ncbi:MAG: hypothetical protein ABSG89_07250 [Bacteroidales bacterium]
MQYKSNLFFNKLLFNLVRLRLPSPIVVIKQGGTKTVSTKIRFIGFTELQLILSKWIQE